jgi:excisionase family DNA binding protein
MSTSTGRRQPCCEEPPCQLCCDGISVKTLGIFGIIMSTRGICWSRWRPCLLCSSTACHPVPNLEEALPPPSRPLTRPAVSAAGRWPDVLDVPLTAPLLTVLADTVYDHLQRGDLPGCKVGRQWLTTKTAVLQWLEHSATPRPTTAQETALAHAMAYGDRRAGGRRTDRARAARHQGPARRAVRPWPGR